MVPRLLQPAGVCGDTGLSHWLGLAPGPPPRSRVAATKHVFLIVEKLAGFSWSNCNRSVIYKVSSRGSQQARMGKKKKTKTIVFFCGLHATRGFGGGFTSARGMLSTVRPRGSLREAG